MKTLAMYKMDKNFIATITKGYPREPYEIFSTGFLLDRLQEEIEELREEYRKQDGEAMRKEVADCSNILDYIFERLANGRLR